MEIELFVFSVEASQFSKFHENQSKHNKLNFDCEIQCQNFVKLQEKSALNFANVLFWG